MPRPGRERHVLSVSELDRRLKQIVEGAGELDVEGEVSNLKEVASGHAYFTLKDERAEASIDCVMYRTAAPRARRLLADGARLVVVGRASLFVPRGRLQFTVVDARPAGRGALLEAYERLKQKLADEGLFAPERKRRLPADPRIIGVVTSADGAALHDIIKVAKGRGRVRILLARAPVQGPDAAARLARALAAVARVPEVDVIILGRGGGSADDLAAFNEEVLVRQVAGCRVPVVTAVGHEIDMSLADLASDARAATPSQAAELIVRDASAIVNQLAHLKARMARATRARLGSARIELTRDATVLRDFDDTLSARRQQLDETREALARILLRRIATDRSAVARLDRRLLGRHPTAVIAAARGALEPARVRLETTMRASVTRRRSRLAHLAARLQAMSPLAVLARGYSITAGEGGALLVDAADAREGELVRVRLHRGALAARVEQVLPGESEGR